LKRTVLIVVTALLFCATTLLAQTFGTKKRAPKPDEYGNVVISNYSKRARMPPVLFRHWFHRSRYTCRLCHVDLGFAMEAGQTLIREEDNRNGLYCGACHNGDVAFSVHPDQSAEDPNGDCRRCHSVGLNLEPEHDFYEFVKGFPKARFGNRVDWLAAEKLGLIELEDYLEGVSIRREGFEVPKDLELDADVSGMPDIIFSHEKHAVWNGCELCHPQIFGIKKASTVFEMQEIFDGKYCGACHGKVAFTNLDCQLCHSADVY
jgi:c(7)-type cytochrome triheme protein